MSLLKESGLLQTKWSLKQEELDKLQPLTYIIDWFKSKLKKNNSVADRILILKSGTGSGKSTIFPAELYHTFYEDMRRGLACLQPKILLAVDIPTNSVIPYNTKEALKASGKASRTPLELGVNIGYQSSAFHTQPVRGLTYMTIGTLTQQLAIMNDEDFMAKYGFIIADEAHERSIDTDMVILSLKKFVERNYKNPLCPFVIVTSATFDTQYFCDYMLSSVKAPERYQNIIEVKGDPTFPITEKYLEYDTKNFIQTTINTVATIHKEHSEDFLGPAKSGGDDLQLEEDAAVDFKVNTLYRDILIFVSGNADITAIKAGVDKLNSEDEFFKKYPVVALKLAGAEVNNKTQNYIDIIERSIDELNVEIKTGNSIQIKKPTRRVIIATNVAETGITFVALKHVINTGFRKASQYSPIFGYGALVLQPVSRGVHIQRKGRVGRRAPGFSYPMFTETSFNEMLEDDLPSMMTDNTTLQILKMIILEVDPKNSVNDEIPANLFSTKPSVVNELRYEMKGKRTDLEKMLKSTPINVAKFDLLDLPSADAIHESLEKLFVLGAIDSNMVPTSVGFLVNKFRYIPVESIKMILSGYAWGASINDLATIAAFMEFHKDLRPRKMAKKRDRAAAANIGAINMGNAVDKISGYSELYKSLLIADDFIDNLLLYIDFQKHIADTFINNTGESSEFDSMESWCAERGVDYNKVIDATESRDTIINTLASIGLDPFANADNSLSHIVNTYQNSSRSDLLQCVKRLKQCLYEGYKLNLAEWNPKAKAYISRQTHQFLPFFNPLFAGKRDISKYGDGNPRFIIYDRIHLDMNEKTGIYVPKIDGISVLDGFVSVDV
jgi:HrpA-like RNA helicase